MMLTILILQAERVKVKPIFYDANQTWQKIEGQLGDFVLKYCGNGFEALAYKKQSRGWMDGWMNGVLGHFYALSRLNWADRAEQRNFVKLRKALKFKEANILTLKAINLVASQCGD